jgi:hypothetical protein
MRGKESPNTVEMTSICLLLAAIGDGGDLVGLILVFLFALPFSNTRLPDLPSAKEILAVPDTRSSWHAYSESTQTFPMHPF